MPAAGPYSGLSHWPFRCDTVRHWSVGLWQRCRPVGGRDELPRRPFAQGPTAVVSYCWRVLIRPKTEADSAAVVALALEVHRRDGYPRYLPDDLRTFLSPDYEEGAWVAELNGHIVGHVAVHDAAVDPTLLAAQRATGLGAERLAVLARLVVAPVARRRGLARALMATATQHAAERGRQRVILDVVQDADAAIRLYNALGWQRVDTLELTAASDHRLDLWVYVSPLTAT